MGLKKYGKGDWRNISRNFVTTRTPTQVASHAQKYFIRQLTGGKDKRRSSIHDITMVNLPEVKTTPSSDNITPALSNHSMIKIVSPQQNHKFSGMNIKQESDNMPMVFNPTNGNMLLAPIYGISLYGSKPQEQSLLRGTLHGCDFGPYDAFLQMQSMRYH